MNKVGHLRSHGLGWFLPPSFLPLGLSWVAGVLPQPEALQQLGHLATAPRFIHPEHSSPSTLEETAKCLTLA